MIALNAELSSLKQMISKEFEKDQATDELTGESSSSSNDEMQLSITDVTLELSRLHQFILKWKSLIDSKKFQSENEIQKLAEENDRVSRESNVQLEQLTEKHDNLSKLALKESALQVTDTQNKLGAAENAVAQLKDEINSLSRQLAEVSLSYEDCRESLAITKQQVTVLNGNKDEFEKEISSLKVKVQSQRSEHQTVRELNINLKSKLEESEAREVSLRNKLEESEAKLRIKALEQEKLQEAFQNVNGLVFDSFADFETYYKTQLLDKDKGLEVKDSENKTLERRLNLLTEENCKLKDELEQSQTMFTSTKHELELCVEKLHKQDKECAAVKLQAQNFVEIFERTSNVFTEHRSRKSDLADSSSTEESLPATLSEKCLTLVNELNKTEKQLKIYEEDLKNAADERNTVESDSKALALEVHR